MLQHPALAAAAPLAALLLAAPARAQCALPLEVQVHTSCYPADCQSLEPLIWFYQPLAVPKFDPALGALERVELDFSGTLSIEFCWINLGPICCPTLNYQFGAAFVLEPDPANVPPPTVGMVDLVSEIVGTAFDIAGSDGAATPDDCFGNPGCNGADGTGISQLWTETAQTVVIDAPPALDAWLLGSGADQVTFRVTPFTSGSTSTFCVSYNETLLLAAAARLEVRYVYCPASPGVPYCAGDGSGAACPCGNPGAAQAGCANSTGLGGRLASAGSASALADDLELLALELVPFQPALLAVADLQNSGGAGEPFGDGLRCVAGSVVRLAAALPAADGTCGFGPGLAALGLWGPGDTRHFQARYRDPAGPCGAGFNLTNGVSVSFAP